MSSPRPPFTPKDAERVALDVYGIDGTATEMPSYDDRNFKISTFDAEFTLKISMAGESPGRLDLQDQVMQRLSDCSFEVPSVVSTLQGGRITRLVIDENEVYLARLLTFVPGTMVVDVKPQPLSFLRDVGAAMGEVAQALDGFQHPAMDREFAWDLLQAQRFVTPSILEVVGTEKTKMLEQLTPRFDDEFFSRINGLRKSVVHNDANDRNMLAESTMERQRVSGLFDFGDTMRTATVADIAITAAYCAMNQDRPLDAVSEMAAGFHAEFPLLEEELDVLFDLICLRLCTSACFGAAARAKEPDNEYISVHEAGAWRLIETFAGVSRSFARDALRQACGFDPNPAEERTDSERQLTDELILARGKSLGPSLSVSYKDPLNIVRGDGVHLYDESGREYLDCVNNVCHVGHCHPKVVEAGQRQMAVLNTNTRYLNNGIVQYAERILSIFPHDLDTVFFVNSGSEANELALRLAKTYTGAEDVVVIDGAYHGNTSSMIDLSPYKFNGEGGHGKPDHVHVLPMPDPYRQKDHSYELPDDRRIAALFAESMLGCGGQIVLPDGYLQDLFAKAREAGALCVADEVQTGFGRVGSHFWAFETQGVVPDIVTLGKPMGNGHPLAAVVTKREIAEKFANGMEYFNTYGGNPVSCAIGAAVLDVVEEEELQDNAYEVGSYLLKELEELKEKHTLIGDVRGLGLFIGVELVRDRDTLEPAAEEADYTINRLRDLGVLVSTDGPLHNVLKIKPPIVFSMIDADRLLSTLDEVLSDTCLTE